LELRARLEKPLGGRDRMAEEAERIQVLGEQVHKLDLIVTAMRAQLVASERYYEQTRKDQKIDHHAFLNQAAGLREAIAQYEEKVARLRDRVSRAQVRLRYHDPRRDAWHRALVRYQNHLVHMYGALAKVAADDPQGRTLWRRSVELQERTGRARGRLEGAAVKRLEGTMAILVAERANLDQYLHELTQARASTKDLVAQVLAASYQDLLVEVRSLVVRSEVGLLDVAWGMKEAEMEQVQRLELERDRDLRELDRALEAGLGVLEP
jgi:hypothetical protein